MKSPREIEYARRAAALADDAWDEAVRLTRPGAFEGDILAAMQSAVFRGGDDYTSNEFTIGSGPGALLCLNATRTLIAVPRGREERGEPEGRSASLSNRERGLRVCGLRRPVHSGPLRPA